MKILYAGTPELAASPIDALIAAGHEIVGVLTRPDAPIGRKRVLTPSAVAQHAADLGIPVYKTNRLDTEALEWAQSLTPDVGVVVAYGGILGQDMLDTPTHGWINLHFSDLPRWRGAAPVQRALMAGEETMHVTVFRLVAELDAGDVLTRAHTDIERGLTASDVFARLSPLGADAICEALELLERNPDSGEPQHGEPTFASKLSRDDGKLDLTRSAFEVLAHWGGVTPEPGAFVGGEEGPLKLHHLELASDEDSPQLAAGEAALHSARAYLGTGKGTLEMLTVQPAGKPRMQGSDWLRGRGGKAQLS